MHRLRLHLRPVVVAVATLALSAGVVFAGGGVVMPESAADGLAVAAEAAGKVVPPAVGLPAVPNEPADEEPAEEEPAQEEPGEDPATEEEPAEEEPCPVLDEYPNHGAKVCAAAQGEVPEGYASRGAYVREVARANHGSEIAAQKEANGGVPDAAKAAKERSKEKPKAGGAGSPPNRP